MLDNFARLCQTLCSADLHVDGPPAPPWAAPNPSVQAVRAPIEAAATWLPLAYQWAYVEPLLERLEHALVTLDDPETLAGAVYQHGRPEVQPQLGRLLVVLAELHRAFLGDERRAALRLPPLGRLPPLAAFRGRGAAGPFTVRADDLLRAAGAAVTVVSLPSAYRDHPILLSALAHETAGRDVARACPGLLPELSRALLDAFGVGTLFPGERCDPVRLCGLLCAYGIEAVVADVCGVLHGGPTRAINLAALLSALLAQTEGSGVEVPRLRSHSLWGGEALDPIPVDLLRVHVALGATRGLAELGDSTRAQYTEALTELGRLCAGDAAEIALQGVVRVPGAGAVHLDETMPLDEMRGVAERAGQLLVTAPLETLGGRTLQGLATWTNSDEAMAQAAMVRLLSDESIVGLGDTAQLLAGATLAVLADPSPERYARVSRQLGAALDERLRGDPVWGRARPEPMLRVGREPPPRPAPRVRPESPPEPLPELPPEPLPELPPEPSPEPLTEPALELPPEPVEQAGYVLAVGVVVQAEPVGESEPGRGGARRYALHLDTRWGLEKVLVLVGANDGASLYFHVAKQLRSQPLVELVARHRRPGVYRVVPALRYADLVSLRELRRVDPREDVHPETALLALVERARESDGHLYVIGHRAGERRPIEGVHLVDAPGRLAAGGRGDGLLFVDNGDGSVQALLLAREEDLTRR